MRKTARAIRAYNPIQSKITPGYINSPIKGMIEDIFESASHESYFIQIVDFIEMYYKKQYHNEKLAHRASRVVDDEVVKEIIGILK